MKKLLFILLLIIPFLGFGQTWEKTFGEIDNDVSYSVQQTNYSDAYGNSTGTAKTTTDWTGRTIITYYDQWGNVTETKTVDP
jgi:hypothetical protein